MCVLPSGKLQSGAHCRSDENRPQVKRKFCGSFVIKGLRLSSLRGKPLPPFPKNLLKEKFKLMSHFVCSFACRMWNCCVSESRFTCRNRSDRIVPKKLEFPSRLSSQFSLTALFRTTILPFSFRASVHQNVRKGKVAETLNWRNTAADIWKLSHSVFVQFGRQYFTSWKLYWYKVNLNFVWSKLDLPHVRVNARSKGPVVSKRPAKCSVLICCSPLET